MEKSTSKVKKLLRNGFIVAVAAEEMFVHRRADQIHALVSSWRLFKSTPEQTKSYELE